MHRASNSLLDDFYPLRHRPGVGLRWVPGRGIEPGAVGVARLHGPRHGVVNLPGEALGAVFVVVAGSRGVGSHGFNST